MREIKFRAWDKCEKQMFAIERFQQIPTNWRDCLDLMQFTGLKDVAGREIYEGDILRRPGFESVWKVESDTGCFLKKSIANGYSSHLHEDDNMEIIGNIHENPELLK